MVHAGCRGRERDGAGREERDVCSMRGCSGGVPRVAEGECAAAAMAP